MLIKRFSFLSGDGGYRILLEIILWKKDVGELAVRGGSHG